MKTDVITYNATISACEKGQQWITAVSLMREMQHRNMEADVITYNATAGPVFVQLVQQLTDTDR